MTSYLRFYRHVLSEFAPFFIVNRLSALIFMASCSDAMKKESLLIIFY